VDLDRAPAFRLGFAFDAHADFAGPFSGIIGIALLDVDRPAIAPPKNVLSIDKGIN
jgi:hypothetical protein